MADRTCPDCGEQFKYPCDLKRHGERKQSCLAPKGISKKDEESGLFNCPYCPAVFKHQSNLSRHIHNTCEVWKARGDADPNRKPRKTPLIVGVPPGYYPPGHPLAGGSYYDLNKFRPPPEAGWSCVHRGKSITFEEARLAAISAESRAPSTERNFRCERINKSVPFRPPTKNQYVLHPCGPVEPAEPPTFVDIGVLPRKNSPQCPPGVYAAEITPGDKITEPDEVDPATGKRYQYLVGVPLTYAGTLDWTQVIDPSSSEPRKTPYTPLEKAAWLEFAKSMADAMKIAESLTPQFFLRDNPNRGTLRFNFGDVYSIIVE